MYDERQRQFDEWRAEAVSAGFSDGSLSIQKRFERLLPSIEEARADGLGWQQIATGLAKVGLVKRDGTPLSERHAANLYSRCQNRQQTGRPRRQASTALPLFDHAPNTAATSGRRGLESLLSRGNQAPCN